MDHCVFIHTNHKQILAALEVLAWTPRLAGA
jgi:hypothetical protein